MTETARALVAKSLDLPDVPPTASALDTPAWDSLGHMRIVLSVEACLGRLMTPEELSALWDIESVQVVLDRSA